MAVVQVTQSAVIACLLEGLIRFRYDHALQRVIVIFISYIDITSR